MARRVEARREALKTKLIDIAETTIATDGIGAIRACDLARNVGCAVGAIQNVFADMGEIIIAVNGRTFRALGRKVAASVRAAPDDPVEQLIAMSIVYLHYAIDTPSTLTRPVRYPDVHRAGGARLGPARVVRAL